MQAIDKTFKRYFSHKDIAADLMNLTFYKGKHEITENDITEINTETINDELTKRNRDLVFEVKFPDGKQHDIQIVGIEAQSKVDHSMILRSMEYDFHQMKKQIDDKSNHGKIRQAVTVLLNLSNHHWTARTSLQEYTGVCGEPFSNMFPDYFYHVIDPYEITEETIPLFTSELGSVVKFIQASSSEEKMDELLKTDKKINKLSKDAIRFLSETYRIEYNAEDGQEDKDMCKAWDDHKQSGINEGISIGYEKGIEQGIEQGIEKGNIQAKKEMAIKLFGLNQPIEMIAQVADIDVSQVQKWIRESDALKA